MANDQKWTKRNDNGPTPRCTTYDTTRQSIDDQLETIAEDVEHDRLKTARRTPTEFTRRAPWLSGNAGTGDPDEK